jgi:signal transduction histidine kinase
MRATVSGFQRFGHRITPHRKVYYFRLTVFFFSYSSFKNFKPSYHVQLGFQSFLAIIDFMKNHSTTAQTEETHERFSNLSAYLQAAREEERKSFAREIHDELGQALTTIKLDLSLLQEEVLHDATAATDRIQSLTKRVDETIQTVKSIITKLRPGLLDDLGLTAAMEWQANDFQKHTGIVCEVLMQPEEMNINQEISTDLFRIFQETLTNVARHSGATRVFAQLSQTDDTLEFQVQDNGRGITSEEINDPQSFGLIGIRERTRYWRGIVNIEGQDGLGTIVHIRFPLPPGKQT